MVEPFLRVEALTGGYGDVTVLWDVSFELPNRGAVCLFGANGAGKSTLFGMLSGLIRPRGGRILFAGRDLAGAGPQAFLARGIAHVPEGRRLFGPMSVRDNLLLGAYLRHDTAEIRRDLDRVMTLFPILGERERQLAGTLSGGEQQMCAIARGLMSRPKLLMIDELSLGLAPQVIEKLAEVLSRIVEEGVIVFLVEQDVLTALELTEAGIVLDSGRVVLSGPSAALADDPTIRASFLGLEDDLTVREPARTPL
jgi:branched-chain amino acid transport system ATP-binding protein